MKKHAQNQHCGCACLAPGQHHGQQEYTAGLCAVGGQAQAAMLPAGWWEPILPLALFGFWALLSSLAPPRVPGSLGRHKANW